MNFINKIYIGLALVASLGVCSCGDGTEVLTPGDPEVNYFEVDPSDKSRDAEIRREFYDKTGVYLLFSDLLATYTDKYGIERTETLDFNWSINSGNKLTYIFDLLEEDEKEHVSDLVTKYFIPYINIEGCEFKPYSIFLVKGIETPGEYDEYPEYLSSWRCFCVDVYDWIDADEETAFMLGRDVLRTLIDDKLSRYSEKLYDFFAVSEEGYDAYYVSNCVSDWVEDQDIEKIYELGFTTYFPDRYGEPEYDALPYESTDFRLFKDLIFNLTEDEFLEQWGEYPLIVQKYYFLKEAIESYGVDLNAVKK